ncbi:hypothetical protein MKW94_026508 [Papaver nudicaule]|uniref:S-protein homolog n=1 Tax=Papaver nudicaule TaxID=74823 RepID=A0AA41UU88_PAPNU|nr:hypothetical protein [Papaver nudicaule]
MPKPFLVSGSSSAIFFSTLLTLSLILLQLVDGAALWEFKKTVTVENDIDPNVPLTIHCWSSDDDLGEHILYYKQSFHWRFHVNIWQTTTFECDSSWHDPGNGDQLHSMTFKAYRAKRDWEKNCVHDCLWSIRRDGGYYGDGFFFKIFPLKKIFSY